MPWNTAGNIKGPKGDKGDAADVAALIHAATSKTPADADELALLDSASSWTLRKFTWATLKSTLQSLFFYRGNIVGTVSQSGGAPTGAIIQRGSNANGEFVRYADGTQICFVALIIPTSTVAAFAQYVPAATVWTFPAIFAAKPVYIHMDPVEAGSGYFYCRPTGVGASGTNALYLTNTSNASQATPANLVGLAIGRWF